jgi:hypothetical protein
MTEGDREGNRGNERFCNALLLSWSLANLSNEILTHMALALNSCM